MIIRLLFLVFVFTLPCGCAMFTAWKTIPPPGGCDQCHHVPIGANWQVTYQAPALSDERNKLSFQTEQATMPQPEKPASSLDLRKVQEQPCFECHRSPDVQHLGRKGHYHH
ncbi:MAG TPA: cytochrome C [Geobacteraceae bacterium]